MKGFELVDIIIALAGVYLVYAAIRMKTSRELNSNLMWGGKKMKDCKDPEAACDYLFPHTLVIGLIIIADGLLGYTADRVEKLSFMNNYLFAVTLAALVWFVAVTRKANKRYFD